MTNLKRNYAPEEANEMANENLQEIANSLDGVGEMHAKLTGLALQIAQHAKGYIDMGEEFLPMIHAVDHDGQHFVVDLSGLITNERTPEEIGDKLRELMKAADVRYFVMSQESYIKTMEVKDEEELERAKEQALQAFKDGHSIANESSEEALIMRGEADDGSLIFVALHILNDGINKTLQIGQPMFLERSTRGDSEASGHGMLVNSYGHLMEVNDAVVH